MEKPDIVISDEQHQRLLKIKSIGNNDDNINNLLATLRIS